MGEKGQRRGARMRRGEAVGWRDVFGTEDAGAALHVDEDECRPSRKKSGEEERAGSAAMSSVGSLGKAAARGEGEDGERDRNGKSEGCGGEDFEWEPKVW